MVVQTVHSVPLLYGKYIYCPCINHNPRQSANGQNHLELGLSYTDNTLVSQATACPVYRYYTKLYIFDSASWVQTVLSLVCLQKILK
jgi:hypothetical protein